MTDAAAIEPPPRRDFSGAEIGALAHLYRGEVYRSTIWRTRLDNTTNWSVVTIGIALSITFSNRDASPLPLVFAGVLSLIFLVFEARRYRYFNVWRARARWMEKYFYAPMLRGEVLGSNQDWPQVLAADYFKPRHHISMARAIGRRLRRNYMWIFVIQALAYYGKITIHPTPLTDFSGLVERAAVGPVPGELLLLGNVLFNGGWIAFAVVTYYLDYTEQKQRPDSSAMG